MARDWSQLAQEVVDLVGGKDNVMSVAHCITRLRFRLKDESIADDVKVSAIDGVIQVMRAAGQYQLVIGPQVENAYDAVVEILPGLGGARFPWTMGKRATSARAS